MFRKIAAYITLLQLFVFPLISQKAKFVSGEIGTAIHVLNRKIGDEPSQMSFNASGGVLLGGNWVYIDNKSNASKTDTIFIGIDSGYYKCNTEYTLLYLDNPRYRSTTQLMPTGSFNANKKRYLCTKLAPLKKRKNEEAYLKINGIEINIDRKRYRQNYYESYADYLKQNIEHEYVSEHEIKIRRTIFEKDIDRFLAATNYLDTTDNNNLSSRYKIEIDMVVNAATEYKFGRYCVVELSTTVKLPAFFGMQREKTYITRSCIGFDDSNQDEANNTGLIANALENTLINLLEDASLKEKFVNPEEAMNKLLSKEEELVLENKLNGPSNIENATNAVVTILQKNWHGSGCIVSNNCYVITNYHVTGADTSEIYAIFTSGTKRRCRFIRGNYSSDLALLKIDTTISIPLKINTNKAIGVGADVYAIGTPRDINLGQTITKGIISAKRVMDGKIYIQSDASVNEGNSGGALINKEGELIGIVNSKLIGVGVEGVSFAIPAFYIEEALKVKIRN